MLELNITKDLSFRKVSGLSLFSSTSTTRRIISTTMHNINNTTEVPTDGILLPSEPLSLPFYLPFNDSEYWAKFWVDDLDESNNFNCTGAPKNGTSNCTLVPELEYLIPNYWFLLLLIFPILTVFGNLLVILSVKRERSLQNVTNYFIVSLAVADLLVAVAVMPFGVYFLVNQTEWGLPPIFCDVYIAMDVTCSTSSICNLVAISIDRFIAVTQPIKYAKHKSNTRVWLTIVFVWAFSGLVGSPIVLGLNSPPLDPSEPTDTTICTFHNKYFVLFSSLCSFYIPCAILVCLYYRIFKVIRERAKKAIGAKKPSNIKGITVIENITQTKRLAETTLGGPITSEEAVRLTPIKSSQTFTDEKFPEEIITNTGSGSQYEDDVEEDGRMSGSLIMDTCQIIQNPGALQQAAATLSMLPICESQSRRESGGSNACGGQMMTVIESNENHDSGYATSNLGETLHFAVPGRVQEPNTKKKLNNPKTNGVIPVVTCGETKKPVPSRFTIYKLHKASMKKREKSSAKRERKATQTLAIVLGLFLACWLPFFTCNIMDAICSLLPKSVDCSPGMTVFLLTTWLGYINSVLNPLVYTIFNLEFRKAFKKILGMKT